MIGKIINEFWEICLGVIREGWIYIGILLLGLGYVWYLWSPPLDVLLAYLKEILILIWPIILAYVLFRVWLSMWMHWRQEIFTKQATKWKVVEMRIPREIRKNSKAMEQVFASIHGMRNAPGNFREHYWDGEVTRWFSFEMVSFGGEVHFYLRFHQRLFTLMQTAFNSFYPDIELEEVDDYAHHRLPQSIQEVYTKNYDLWGGEVTLKREGAYPIRTYEEFESATEEKEYDTMSAFMELLGKLKKEEFIGIQILAVPLGPEWAEEHKELIEKLRRPESKPEKMINAEGEEIEYQPLAIRTPGETEVLEAIERNLSKPAFETLIRFIYLSPKHLYHDSYPRRGVKGAFNQFSKISANSLEINYDVATRVQFWKFPYFFPGLRGELRKQRVLYNYIHREMPPETFMGKLQNSSIFDSGFKTKLFEMNIECLATIWHPPSYIALTAPHTQRVESKRVGPSASLPIYGSDEDIERFL